MAASLRINFILPFYSSRPIGGLKVVYEYASQLATRGHAVKVVHPRLNGIENGSRTLIQKTRTSWTNLINSISPPSRVNWLNIKERFTLLHVPSLDQEHIPDGDVVCATTYQTAESVAEYSSHKGKKFYLVQDFAPWIATANKLEETWRLPLRKITVSEWLYSQVRRIESDDSKLVNIPNGVDLEVFRALVGVKQRPKRVAMFYSSAPNKDSNCGLAAIEKCKTLHPDLEATFFGANSRRRPKRIPDWIVYRGNVSQAELVQIYNSARVFVCSSIAEGFGLPGAEAMACGCAVASTDCGGNREYASHDVNSLLSPAGDASALASNIARLLSDEGLRVEIAERGHRMIQDFTWERSTNHLEEFLNAR